MSTHLTLNYEKNSTKPTKWVTLAKSLIKSTTVNIGSYSVTNYNCKKCDKYIANDDYDSEKIVKL